MNQVTITFKPLEFNVPDEDDPLPLAEEQESTIEVRCAVAEWMTHNRIVRSWGKRFR